MLGAKSMAQDISAPAASIITVILQDPQLYASAKKIPKVPLEYYKKWFNKRDTNIQGEN